MKKEMQKEEVSRKKTKAKDVRIDSAKKINTKSKMENAEETSKKKTKVKPKVEKIEQPQKKRKFHKYLWYLIIFSILGLILECVINFIKAKTTDTPFLVTTGPFCIFYGIGAILTILCLQQYKGKKIKGSKTIEYSVALPTIKGLKITFYRNDTYGDTLDFDWNMNSATMKMDGYELEVRNNGTIGDKVTKKR